MSNSYSSSDEDDGDELDGNIRLPVSDDDGVQQDQSDSSSDFDSDVYVNNQSGYFDTDLPTSHLYLGRLDSISGYTLFDDYFEISLLAIFTDSVVFPGFTLPLVLTDSREQETIKQYLETSRTLGLVFSDPNEPNVMFNYGVTMDVYESYDRADTYYLKAKGRQRFKIIKTDRAPVQFYMSRLRKLTVRILPEAHFESPLAASQLLSLKKWMVPLVDYKSQQRNKPYRRIDVAQFTFPLWLYDKYEIYYYVNEITKSFDLEKIPTIPTDPVQLSYWFVQNYQLEHVERLEVLKFDSALQRLQLELKYLRKRRLICCKICSAEIADRANVFAMSKDGLQSNYCNPGGYVYETLTVSEAEGADSIGVPSKQFSWFPGYGWTIAKCRGCHGQIGWRFSSDRLLPKKFWGLAKRCISTRISSSDQESL